VETGIDASHEGIYLEWVLPEDRDGDLTGVVIYRSQDPDSQFLPLQQWDEDLVLHKDVTHYVDTSNDVFPNPETGCKRWFYYLRALDRAGNRSIPSDTASYRLWFKPSALTATVVDDGIRVGFSLPQLDASVTGVLVKFQDEETGNYLVLSRELYQTQFDESIPFDIFPPFQWETTVFRVDVCIAGDTHFDTIPSNPELISLSGSESAWKSITASTSP